MTRTAQIILTGYDDSKIQKSVSIIKDYSEEIGFDLDLEPPREEQIKAKSKLWGCEKNSVQHKIIDVTGKKDDLQKIIDLRIADGIYLQLLLK